MEGVVWWQYAIGVLLGIGLFVAAIPFCGGAVIRTIVGIALVGAGGEGLDRPDTPTVVRAILVLIGLALITGPYHHAGIWAQRLVWHACMRQWDRPHYEQWRISR